MAQLVKPHPCLTVLAPPTQRARRAALRTHTAAVAVAVVVVVVAVAVVVGWDLRFVTVSR